MKLNYYICDICGVTSQDTGEENIFSLTILFQNPYENIGVKHICGECKPAFEDKLNNLFTHLNKVKKL